MRKYYTRPCNFYYGNYAANLIRNKKAFSLAGNPKIAFDQVEIFQRSGKGTAKSEFYSIEKNKKHGGFGRLGCRVSGCYNLGRKTQIVTLFTSDGG